MYIKSVFEYYAIYDSGNDTDMETYLERQMTENDQVFFAVRSAMRDRFKYDVFQQITTGQEFKTAQQADCWILKVRAGLLSVIHRPAKVESIQQKGNGLTAPSSPSMPENPELVTSAVHS